MVRANFIYEGKTGNCATVRRVTVTPSSDAPKGTATPSTPISCAALLVSKPTTPDGVYQIDPDGAAGPLGLISVFCDMTNDAGGWTRVINIKNGVPIARTDFRKSSGNLVSRSTITKR